MKKLLIALLLLLVPSLAYAQQWDVQNGGLQTVVSTSTPAVIIDQRGSGKILSLRANGVEKCYADASGNLNCAGTFTITGPILGPDGTAAAPAYSFSAEPTFGGWRPAAANLLISKQTSATRLDVANTYTSASNNELFSVDWQTVANTAIIGSRTAATGSGRPLHLVSQTNLAGDDFAMIRLNRLGFPMIQLGLSSAAGTFGTSLTSAGTLIQLASVTNTATSGSFVGVAVAPTYNQASGNAANTDLLINRTQTLVGSGAQYLIDAQVSTVSKFSVDNGGNTVLGNGSLTAAPLTIRNGTNLTTATANAIENDGVSLYQTIDTTNGRKADDSWNMYRLDADSTGISGIADFFAATGSGIPLVANGFYELEYHCVFTQATAGTATWTIVTATTALAYLDASYIGTNIAGAGTVGAPQMAGVNTTSSSSTALPVTGTEATGVTHIFEIHVMLKAGNGASNTRLRLTMGAGTATPKAGSYVKVRRLPTANTGTFSS